MEQVIHGLCKQKMLPQIDKDYPETLMLSLRDDLAVKLSEDNKSP
jgi:hypothetical protein